MEQFFPSNIDGSDTGFPIGCQGEYLFDVGFSTIAPLWQKSVAL